MTLDPAYLEYPRRREGYDHDLYDWSSIHARPAISWPGGTSMTPRPPSLPPFDTPTCFWWSAPNFDVWMTNG